MVGHYTPTGDPHAPDDATQRLNKEQIQIRELERRIEKLEKFINEHIGNQPGAHSVNSPHPQLSAVSLGLYTPTNVTTDRSYDADTVLVAELADVVGTLIADLQAIRILG